MRRVSASTQAMIEFQRMLEQVSDVLTLTRNGRFWELWYTGDDFGRSEAEIAELQSENGGYYSLSEKYCSIKIDAKGSIKAFQLENRNKEHRSLLQQLDRILELIIRTDYVLVIDFRIDVRPNGSMIDVDVISIEDNSGFVGDEFVEEEFERIVGRFAFDPARQLLLHRTN